MPFFMKYSGHPCLSVDLIHHKADEMSTAIPEVQSQDVIDESSPEEIKKQLEAITYVHDIALKKASKNISDLDYIRACCSW